MRARSSSGQLAARRARFAGQGRKAAAARAQPVAPRVCHPGGKVVSNKDEAVKKFLKRKGLTERQACEVRQREQTLARKQAFVRAPAPGQKENKGPVAGAVGAAGAAGTDDQRKLRKLRGKVLEIEALKAKIGTGKVVHVNRPMQEKIAKLPALQAQIKALLH